MSSQNCWLADLFYNILISALQIRERSRINRWAIWISFKDSPDKKPLWQVSFLLKIGRRYAKLNASVIVRKIVKICFVNCKNTTKRATTRFHKLSKYIWEMIISKRAYVQVRLWDNSWVMSNKFLKYLELDITNIYEKLIRLDKTNIIYLRWI